MTNPINRYDFDRPQIIYTDDNRLRTIGHQLEASELTNRTIGPIASPSKSLRDIIGLFDNSGGRIFLTEGEWIFNDVISTARNSVHIISTSPGKTVFKRPSAKASSSPMMSFTGDDIILEGIRFIDEGNTTSTNVLSFSGQRCQVKDCVFEDAYGGVTVSGSWCSIKDNTFTTLQGYAVELTGSASNCIVSGNLIQDDGGSVYLGDSVSEVAVVSNVFQNTSGGAVKISYFANKEIVTGSALNVVHADQVQERS